MSALSRVGILLLALAPSRAEAIDGPPRNQIDGRISLAQTYGADDQTGRRLIFEDLRTTLAVRRPFGIDVGLYADGRGRKSWGAFTGDRLAVHELYLAINDSGRWRLSLGRQLVRAVGSAGVDGARLELRIGGKTTTFLFGGLVPHPITADFDYRFTGGGAGYDFRGEASTHSGGAVVMLYNGDLERVYVSQQSTVRLGSKASLFGSAIVDFASRDGLVELASKRYLDPTSLYLQLRYQPFSWLVTSFAAMHNHTVLPGLWWADWLAERKHQLGFVLDGIEPVGTRITSLRWTNDVPLGREVIPYVQLRYDWRHTSGTQGMEVRGGLKWRPRWGYVDGSYAYRNYFSTENHLGSLSLGIDRPWWGGEAGAMALDSVTAIGRVERWTVGVDAALWLFWAGLFGKGHRAQLLLLYQGFVEPDLTTHTGTAQVSYRF